MKTVSNAVTLNVESLVHVDLVSERMSERQSGEEHLDADDEVLVTGGNSPLPHADIRRVYARNRATFLQNRQQHPYSTQNNTVLYWQCPSISNVYNQIQI